MRRERKYELYDLFIEMPQPLVSRDACGSKCPSASDPDGPSRPRSTRRAAAARAGALVAGAASNRSRSRSCTPTPNPAHEHGAARDRANAFPMLAYRCPSKSRPRSASTSALHDGRERLHQAARATAISMLSPASSRARHHAPLFLMLSNGGLTHLARSQAHAGAAPRIGTRRGRAGRSASSADAQHRRRCSRSTWAARPPSSRSSTNGEPLDRVPASRRRARSDSPKAADCRSRSRRSS